MQQPIIVKNRKDPNLINPDDIFHYKGKRLLVKWEILFSLLLDEKKLHKEEVKLLIKAVNKYLRAEPNMLYLHDPVTIVGDIHGQFYDLKEIFRLGENPGTMTKYLFLGDYVDRGNYSIEVLLVLYSLKITFPNQVFLLRGNHECKIMTILHNFQRDCIKVYDQEVYNMFLDSFNNLPIACVINGKYLAVHGGLSPDIDSIIKINEIQRFREPPKDGILCDILWSDPIEQEKGIMSEKYQKNDSRGCSFYFGYDATINFLRNNELMTIIRAHEMQQEGYRAYHWGNSIFPILITVFSAPNYCGHHKNKGALLKLNQNEIQIMQYCHTEKKELIFDAPEIFSCTIPVITEGIYEISNNLQRIIIKNGFDCNSKDDYLEKEFDEIFNKIKHKIKFRINENCNNTGVLKPIKVGPRTLPKRATQPPGEWKSVNKVLKSGTHSSTAHNSVSSYNNNNTSFQGNNSSVYPSRGNSVVSSNRSNSNSYSYNTNPNIRNSSIGVSEEKVSRYQTSYQSNNPQTNIINNNSSYISSQSNNLSSSNYGTNNTSTVYTRTLNGTGVRRYVVGQK